jgi:hypothetical protein
MSFLKQKIEQEYGINCYFPYNGSTHTIPLILILATQHDLLLCADVVSIMLSGCQMMSMLMVMPLFCFIRRRDTGNPD